MCFLSGGLIAFSSSTQRIVAQSTSESELVALNSAAKEGIYISSLLGELGFRTCSSSFDLLTDNRSALSLASNGAFSSRSRHIAVRFASLREWVKDGRLALDFVGTKAMLADGLTKALARPIFESLIKQIENFK